MKCSYCKQPVKERDAHWSPGSGAECLSYFTCQKPKYGVYDTKDKCWLGQGANGPSEYDEKKLAMAAATVATQMMRYPLGRLRALPLPEDEDPWQFKDKVEAEVTVYEAIAELGRKP